MSRTRLVMMTTIISALVLVVIAVGYTMNSQTCSGGSYEFGLIGQRYDNTHLQEEREAGIEVKVFELSWRQYYSSEGVKNEQYIQTKKAQMEELREAGFKVILSLGYHDTPRWIHDNYENSYYVDQFGERWTGDTFYNGTPTDNGDANLVFNDQLRGLLASYMEEIFQDFGTDFYGVRLGGGRYGEVTYPPASFDGKDNLYWGYDHNARDSAEEAGIGGWRPGQPSPDGEADKFLDWYLDSLVEYQNWQVKALRDAGYDGRAMMLYPGWGVRPGDIEEATATNLDGSSEVEQTEDLQSGHDFARQAAAIEDPNVLLTTTTLDSDASGDDSEDPRDWSPVKYLSYLAEKDPVNPGLYGENTGSGSTQRMLVATSQMQRYGLEGMAWYDEAQLFSGDYATLEDYERVIETYQGCPE